MLRGKVGSEGLTENLEKSSNQINATNVVRIDERLQKKIASRTKAGRFPQYVRLSLILKKGGSIRLSLLQTCRLFGLM